jgi:hypothetical protein
MVVRSYKMAVASVLVTLSYSAAAQTVNCNANFCSLPDGGVSTTAGASSRTNNEAFLGIVWTFGGKIVPELTLGLRSVKTKSSGSTSGAGLDFTFPISNGIAFDKVRLMAIDGRQNAQGELGVGYSVLSSSLLVTGGVQIPYLTAGVDYLLKDGFVPYVGINTLARYKKPNPGVTTGGAPYCSDNTFTLVSATDPLVAGGGPVNPSVIRNGQTCYKNNPA